MDTTTTTTTTTDPAFWDAHIAGAPNFAEAQDRMEQAITAGVRVQDLLALQMLRS